MKYYDIKSQLILPLLCFCIISCNTIPPNVGRTLEQAGNNKTELYKVIEHYKRSGDDQKLKAAYFLIENMPEMSYAHKNQFTEQLMLTTDSAQVDSDTIKSIWIRLEKEGFLDLKQRTIDILEIESNILIDNIDFAFSVWNQVTWAKDFTFEQFCEFILPYRSFDQLPDQHWRKSMYGRYEWALKHDTSSILEVVNRINDSLYWFRWDWHMNFAQELSISEIHHLQLGSCNHHCALKLAILRSLGIPSAKVFGHGGTSWVAVMDEEGAFVDYGSHYAPQKGKYYQQIRHRWYPKVFMESFRKEKKQFSEIEEAMPPLFSNSHIRDVTQYFTPVFDVEVEVIDPQLKNTEMLYLCIFDKKGWLPVEASIIENNRGIFRNMGIRNTYFPMYFIEGRYLSAGSPFYLTHDGKKLIHKADTSTFEEVKLTRKFPISIPARKFSKLMVGAVFEGSNDPKFETSKILDTIKKVPNAMESIRITDHESYQYIRYKSDTIIGVAEIEFYDRFGKPLIGRIIHSNSFDLIDASKAFDGDITTNFSNDEQQIWEAHDNVAQIDELKIINKNTISWIGIDFGEPVSIAEIRYTFRNSWAIIKNNSDYELFYWDNKWISLGTKKGENNQLHFKSPKNALLSIQHKSLNKMDNPFFMMDNKQTWGGYEN
ncbi:MAG: discoidin domain-containing protein [Bacteroidota bacterium]